MTFSETTQSVLILASLGVSGLALFVLASATSRGRLRQPGGPDREMTKALRAQARAIAELQGAVQQLAGEDRRLAGRLRGAVQRVGLVRYDAFDDMGGRLSFSAAMLDGRGDGFVITSINGRTDNRCYAKPVTGGISEHNLSDEETEAIAIALGKAPVRAS